MKRRRVIVDGIGVSPGVAIGHVHLVDRRRLRYPKRHVRPEDVDAELKRLTDAINIAAESLQALSHVVDGEAPDEGSLILNAHLMMIRDPLLLDGAKKAISSDLKCAEWALKSTVRAIRERFDAMGQAYFRERRSDVDFVGERVLAALMRDQARPLEAIAENAVVVAHDLSPADVVTLLKKKVRAIVTEAGGRTSHTAILARAMEIPSVSGVARFLEIAGAGDEIVVDGGSGQVILHPSRVLVAKYRGIARRRALHEEELLAEVDLPSVTVDGRAIEIHANIDLEEEVASALAHGATGVGLYRTEFLYMRRTTLPTLEEHTRAYSHVIDAMGRERPVVMRTLDLGSDKISPAFRLPREENPALGLRACRLGLAMPDVFRLQLRALLMASAGGDLRIMFPMVSGVQELRDVRAILDDERDALEREGIAFRNDIEIGVMIELPSAVWAADLLAREVDFFCVGTNDLIQYMLAVDRGNEAVAPLYRPFHPSMLRALRHVVDAGHAAGLPVSLCGEMAAEPMSAALLLALGFDSISMPLSAIPRVKWAVRRLRQNEATTLLAIVNTHATVGAIERTVHDFMHDALPELIPAAE